MNGEEVPWEGPQENGHDNPDPPNTGWVGGKLYAIDTPGIGRTTTDPAYPVVSVEASWYFSFKVLIGNKVICEKGLKIHLSIKRVGDGPGEPKWTFEEF